MCGTSSGYRNGCRCDKCMKWRADYYRQGAEFDKRMRALKGMDVFVDAAPTARRLQALAVSGWSASMIGADLGLHYRNLTKIRSLDHPLVLTSTAVAVARFYKTHVHTLVKTRAGRIARTRAQANGWHDYLHWVDVEKGITDE